MNNFTGSPPAVEGARAATSMRRRLVRPVLKPAYVFYYRVLYAHRFPGARGLATLVQSLEARTSRGDTPLPAERWEEKYRAGSWEFIRQLHEVPRYATIAAFAHRLRPQGAILDIGCGEGLLQEHLQALGYSNYVGIDLAEAAISQARQRADARTAFAVADAENYTSEDRFDIIVFNECVHYFHQPAEVVARYEGLLAPEGLFIISVFRTPRGDAIARTLLRRYRLIEETAITHRTGTSVLCVLSP